MSDVRQLVSQDSERIRPRPLGQRKDSLGNNENAQTVLAVHARCDRVGSLKPDLEVQLVNQRASSRTRQQLPDELFVGLGRLWKPKNALDFPCVAMSAVQKNPMKGASVTRTPT